MRIKIKKHIRKLLFKITNNFRFCDDDIDDDFDDDLEFFDLSDLPDDEELSTMQATRNAHIGVIRDMQNQIATVLQTRAEAFSVRFNNFQPQRWQSVSLQQAMGRIRPTNSFQTSIGEEQQLFNCVAEPSVDSFMRPHQGHIPTTFHNRHNEFQDKELQYFVNRSEEHRRVMRGREDDNLHVKYDRSSDPHVCQNIPNRYVIYPHVSKNFWVLVDLEIERDLSNESVRSFIPRCLRDFTNRLPIMFCPFCGERWDEWYLESKEGFKIFLDNRKSANERWIAWICEEAKKLVEDIEIIKQIEVIKCQLINGKKKKQT